MLEFGRKKLINFGTELLLDEDDIDDAINRSPAVSSYMDIKLAHSEKLRVKFVRRLWDAGLLRVVRKVRSRVCYLFVRKKNGKQRLVFDCRVPNRGFKAAPNIPMGTGSVWAHMKIPDNELLYMATSDICDYFCSVAILA